MAINLADKYSGQIKTIYVRESIFANRFSKEIDFLGNKTVKIATPQTVPMSEYKREGANRYGTPTEMQDVIQEMTLTRDRSFSLTIDKGNNKDQMNIKGAGRMMKLQLAERAVPEADKYAATRLAQLAGFIVGNSTALSKTNVVDRISEGTQALDDAEVPQEGRTLYINAKAYKALKHSEEFLKIPELGKKALAKGVVGEYDNMEVVKVPAGRWPDNVNFIIVHKDAAVYPVKISETNLHKDPPGISGNLLEGRMYYDFFVFGAKASGVYAEIDTSNGKGVVLTAPVIDSTGKITGDTGAMFMYTTDGSDPRYSASAVLGRSVPEPAGKLVRAYAFKDGAFNSPVADMQL